MNTQEILTIIAMAALGLCLVLAFSKGMTKNLKTKESMTHACSFLVLIAVALLAVTQFLSEKENMTCSPYETEYQFYCDSADSAGNAVCKTYYENPVESWNNNPNNTDPGTTLSPQTMIDKYHALAPTVSCQNI